MSRFFVGQRVRVVYHRNPLWRDLDGATGKVTALNPPPEIDNDLPADYAVLCDDHGGEGRFLAEQLEPILPEGAQPSEFETLAELIDSLQVTA